MAFNSPSKSWGKLQKSHSRLSVQLKQSFGIAKRRGRPIENSWLVTLLAGRVVLLGRAVGAERSDSASGVPDVRFG
jgi:hypothetical protein